jgi:dolichol-phosphate mannosyltransferase
MESGSYGSGISSNASSVRESVEIANSTKRGDSPSLSVTSPTKAFALSLVVPCFNEEGVVETLVDRLLGLEQTIGSQGALEVLFVDDGSTDCTLAEIHDFSKPLKHSRVLRHGKNRGLAAAMMTGIREASASFVGVMDADCTYDPAIMPAMLAKMTNGIDAVTASPYHRDGEVVAVPPWRLRISKAASSLYRMAFRQKLATYTSCCRIYRRSAVEGIELSRQGFVGVTELLWLLDRAGGKIVEFPTRLSSRVLGHSKLKVLKTARQHLTFLSSALLSRLADLLSGRSTPQAES